MLRPDVNSSRVSELFTNGLDAVVRRIRGADILRAVAAGAAVAVLTLIVLAAAPSGTRTPLPISLAAAALVATAVLARRRRFWTREVAAQLLERGYSESRNLIVTAEEFPMDLHLGWADFLGALDKRLDTLARGLSCGSKPQPPQP